MQKFSDAREINYLLIPAFKFRFVHAQHGRVDQNVLVPREFGIETAAQLQQRSQTAVYLNKTGSGLHGPCDHLKQGAFSCAVAAHDAHALAFAHFQIDAAQSVIFLCSDANHATEQAEQFLP